MRRSTAAPPARRRLLGAAAVLSVLAVSGCAAPVPAAAPSPTASAPATASPAAAGCVSDPERVVTAAAPSAEPVTDDLAATLRSALETAFAQQTAPGVVAAVASPDGTWTSAIGEADPVAHTPMTTDVHHRIGSVTKTFVGTIVLQLAEEGALSLDDPISDYVSGVASGDDITLRMLVSMTSGIASYSLDETFQREIFADPYRIWTPDEVIEIGLALPAQFAPGAQFDYSNTNFELLGKVIEQVTGETFDTVLRERITAPLGLTATAMAPDVAPALAEPASRGYTLQGTPDGTTTPVDATDWTSSWAWTAGAMVSTMPELLTYAQAFATGQGLLEESTQIERLTAMAPEGGYGYASGCIDGWFGHTGELPGYNTALYYDTTSNTTVVVLANSDIPSGDCTTSATSLPDPTLACMDPAVRVFAALSAALGNPFTPNPKS